MDRRFDDPAQIRAILATSRRLTYLLKDTYGLNLADITSIRVDGDNVKVDVAVGDDTWRFKAKGLSQALRKHPVSGEMELVFDPALAQALFEIVEEFAPDPSSP